MTHRRRSLFLLMILIAILIAIPVMTFVARQKPVGPVHLLHDGTSVYLKAVTHGTTHRVGRNMYGLNLPFPIEQYDQRTEQSALVFWVFVEPKQRGGFDPVRWDTINTVLDGSGCWISQAETRAPTFGPVKRAWVPESLMSAKAFIFENFPRRGKKLRLRLVDRNGVEPTIEFEADNPVDQIFPIWNAEALPVSRSQHGVTLTMNSVVLAPPAERSGPAWTTTRFQVTENGILTSAWIPVEFNITDATGNRVFNSASNNDIAVRPEQRAGEMLVEIKKGLCPLETAWKLQVRLEKAPGNVRSFEFLAKPSSR
ncbi:MAG: hypothetical protein ABI882_02410 [Acidobacteriota bacterium]